MWVRARGLSERKRHRRRFLCARSNNRITLLVDAIYELLNFERSIIFSIYSRSFEAAADGAGELFCVKITFY